DVALVLPGIVETPMVDQATHDEDFLAFWPNELNMPPSWVVWAIFAAARFRLLEVSVPPGAATLEKLAALAPGVADRLVYWARGTAGWLARPPPGAGPPNADRRARWWGGSGRPRARPRGDSQPIGTGHRPASRRWETEPVCVPRGHGTRRAPQEGSGRGARRHRGVKGATHGRQQSTLANG